MFGYQTYQTNLTNSGNDGAATAIKNGIRHKIIDDYEESYLSVIVTTDNYDINIGTGYQPPRRPAAPLENIRRMLRRNTPAIFVGDMNAKHTALGHTSSNATGRGIKQLLDNGNIRYLPTNFDTWVSAIGRGKPDIILTNSNNYLNAAIPQGQARTSDHFPIIIQLASPPIMIPTTPKHNFHKADWDKFRNELDTVDETDIDKCTLNTIDIETDKWFDQVTTAMEKYIPKTTYRIIPYPQTTQAIKETEQE